MSPKNRDFGEHGRRQDRLLKERVHDPYMTRGWPKEPAVCPQCRVVASNGRWQWVDQPPADAEEQLCPACQRIRDRVPAGLLTISGKFMREHHEEVMNLLHNKVDAERAQRPMKRIMSVRDEDDDGIVVSFTDQHLPRGVGEALERAYEGNLDIHYTEEAGLVRVYWHRD